MTEASRRAARALALACGLFAGVSHAADRLPALGAKPDGITVSGISSGGYMAVQFHVAHSDLVTGAGALAAGPYNCARGSVWTAWFACMKPTSWSPVPDPRALARQAERWAEEKRIAPTGNLRAARVWAFSGTRDETVFPPVVDALIQFYASWVPPANLRHEKTLPAGHAMITAESGGACGVTAPPFVNDCDFDAAGSLLSHLLGAPESPPGGEDAGRLIAFDQREFSDGDPYVSSLADQGYAFVPAACRQARCRIHIAFHGCRQNAEEVGETFVRQAGYNRWAGAHRLVILYPQTIARSGWGGWRAPFSYVFNPRGCWDWWGYTGVDYATRAGAQIRALRAMAERLSSPRAPR